MVKVLAVGKLIDGELVMKMRRRCQMSGTDEGYKEVYFHQYCEKCKYWDCSEKDDPCFSCLEDPVNRYSHKPVKFEEE